jgi:aryl-alcohol dehydrogenase-like predicted oxidoreductase
MQKDQENGISRRQFVGKTLAGATAAAASLRLLEAEEPKESRPYRSAIDKLRLGNSGVVVTRLGMGTGSEGGKVQRDLGQEGFTRLIRHGYDRGIRFIDTADMYQTHSMVGKAIQGIPREELCIQTKMRWEPFVPDAAQVLQILDRFRKEVGVDYFDNVLIHCARKKGWPADLEKMRDGLSRAKEKGLLKAHGVSCHGLPALREVAATRWVDVNLARVNHRGHHMDGTHGEWSEPGLMEESIAELKKIHAAGKGLIGMKITGNGDFREPEERERSVRFAMSSPFVDAVIMGFKSPQEIDEALGRINAALAG